ncbi:MAG: DUF2934 domain-containing protein [Verrucomicrobiota bacterium]
MATKKTKISETKTPASTSLKSGKQGALKKTISKDEGVIVKPKSSGRKARLSKLTPSLKPRFSVEPKISHEEPVSRHDEISLRAYFIAERRQKMGWHGDSHTDWLDAVAQLKAEALEKPVKKR